jgi:cytochrome c
MAAHRTSHRHRGSCASCDRAKRASVLLAIVMAVMGVGRVRAEATTSLLAGDPERGQTLYQACSGCHSIDDNDIGPRHRGVVGRQAGTVPQYAYSAALKASGLVWDAASLDRWLTNPQQLVPGAKMYFSVSDPQKRADIIAYLQLQK